MLDSVHTSTTLRYDPSLCTGCGMCSLVCPHAVFVQRDGLAELAHPERCIECGACQLNCVAGAIEVRAGVGCAVALMWEALFGKKHGSCGCGQQPMCCCPS
ncbi:MAG: ferredoxin family protein [candidate division KSB1 bacterium]|nr:ferredoxin family protein [candidate division KSB1 bacterium]MDZ7294725.1 ferredoxin family protein [candidate division KSB1 bacterium]MDZ7385847.1 ferredoxin family protein [candidate division KSB1 bacterium]MDZ7391729.1 ferredoxin family protein [candidate division KSB1 bacterium]MDZ7413476.1 ferredoxin family protein [candidate division KSB1 bacterium]